MKSKVRKTLEVILVLTPEEAKWLKGMVQNYTGSDVETPKEKEVRRKFWEHLDIKDLKEY